jgi:transcriptional regulator GlxA family with amidase domain
MRDHHRMTDVRRAVVIAAFPKAQTLDVAGPAEVFALAARLGHLPYEVRLVAGDGRPFETTSGMRLVPDRPLGSLRRGAIDTLVVAGGPGVREAQRDQALIRLVARSAGRARRVASVCTGAFVLARAGLLDGRRATTHWSACQTLRRRYPAVRVEDDPIFVRDGKVWTSAGVTAGMDLALAMVEEDAGRDAALEVARQLVLFVRRPGGQSQFSAQLSAELAEREPLRELQSWISDNLDRDLGVEALASRAHMSPRNFARAFKREVGLTPGAYVERVRVERAQHALETMDAPVEVVGRRCGFGTPETMRRAFRRRVGVSPAEYRARFRPALDRAA